eukprot:CAMPEP_0185692208 /NCGR_PEP_ID=MMETSP1164-20130828/2374_1 /TAXON_ID=1104430 /ORGANISM="Chrysoreinhardia sp, Strain CCMP2950" /LENGTH=374 /DNA_ID=CAMNT_0028358927 /DNA_START=157 /DNA_END=1279 /DNA_ORIENTATION=-
MSIPRPSRPRGRPPCTDPGLSSASPSSPDGEACRRRLRTAAATRGAGGRGRRRGGRARRRRSATACVATRPPASSAAGAAAPRESDRVGDRAIDLAARAGTTTALDGGVGVGVGVGEATTAPVWGRAGRFALDESLEQAPLSRARGRGAAPAVASSWRRRRPRTVWGDRPVVERVVGAVRRLVGADEDRSAARGVEAVVVVADEAVGVGACAPIRRERADAVHDAVRRAHVRRPIVVGVTTVQLWLPFGAAAHRRVARARGAAVEDVAQPGREVELAAQRPERARTVQVLGGGRVVVGRVGTPLTIVPPRRRAGLGGLSRRRSNRSIANEGAAASAAGRRPQRRRPGGTPGARKGVARTKEAAFAARVWRGRRR